MRAPLACRSIPSPARAVTTFGRIKKKTHKTTA
jgi:hypothetical protein